ncbi:MAG: ABC transporter ATP-binding protein [bacterium]|nr:ABC transporter ATP-binding protein [bacterium]
MQDNVIELNNVCKTYKGELFEKPFRTLDGITFEVERNKSFGLIGLNGAGKSTTIKIILGLIFPDSGVVKVFGKFPFEEDVKRRLSYLPENPNFYENLKGFELLEWGGRLRGLTGKSLKEEVEKWLFKVGLEKEGGKLIKKYSRGMVQRLGLAQAFIGNPELIILDEPLNGLDPLGRKMARDLIAEALADGATIFFTSHILEDIEKICDRVCIIHRGRILKFVETKEVESLEKEFIKTLEEYEKNS